MIRVQPSQSGQALAESLVILGALGSLWLAVAWLGRLQDVDLQLLHASRRAAFSLAHQGVSSPEDSDAAAVLAAPGHRWQVRPGGDLLADAARIALEPTGQSPARQIGDGATHAAALREELRLGDKAVWRAHASVRTNGQARVSGGLRDFDQLALSWRRQTAILSGSGAAPDDEAVHAVLAASAHAWDHWAQASIRAGKDIDARVHGTDAAWDRARPTWDWLQPWVAAVPQRHLQTGAAP